MNSNVLKQVLYDILLYHDFVQQLRPHINYSDSCVDQFYYMYINSKSINKERHREKSTFEFYDVIIKDLLHRICIVHSNPKL